MVDTIMNKKALMVIKLRKNNVFLNITGTKGDLIKKFSAGTEKYIGAKKKTTIAKFDIATNIGLKLKNHGYKTFSLRFTGAQRHRKSIIKGFKNAGLNFYGTLIDTKMRAHNGCKQKKQKRKKKRG